MIQVNINHIEVRGSIQAEKCAGSEGRGRITTVTRTGRSPKNRRMHCSSRIDRLDSSVHIALQDNELGHTPRPKGRGIRLIPCLVVLNFSLVMSRKGSYEIYEILVVGRRQRSGRPSPSRRVAESIDDVRDAVRIQLTDKIIEIRPVIHAAGSFELTPP